MAEVIIKTDLQPGDVIDVDLDKEKDEIVMRVFLIQGTCGRQRQRKKESK